MNSYWQRTLRSRISRRRALAATGAASAAALLLSACGGGGGDGKQKAAGSSLITPPADTSAAAKRGGTLKFISATEPLHLDGISQSQAPLNILNGLAYSSLVANKPGHLEPSSFTEVVPNLATRWELSPDKLQLTFKLRPGVKWHNKAPVNGRLFDASDVVATWQKYEKVGGNRSAHANSANPDAPIISVSTPDSSTVVYKLKEPSSYILQRFARMISGEIGTIQPKEAGDGGFDPRKEQIGTGGFILDKWEPSVGLTYRRNPEYWDPKEPYIDRIEVPIVPEYAAGLAQFKAGNTYAFTVRPPDILPTKKESPDLSLYSDSFVFNNPGAMIGFGWLPYGSHKKSPFFDERVRQAVSLSIDRDLWLDAIFALPEMRQAGLNLETQYFSSMGYVPEVWIDPRSKDFGPNAKYYTHDVAEAKKLLSAAGYPSGLESDSRYVATGQLVTPLVEMEVMDNMIGEAGFKVNRIPIDYNQDYTTKIVRTQGQFPGWAWRSGPPASPDPLDFFVGYFTAKSTLGLGFSASGENDMSGDPEVTSMIDKAKAEFDSKRRTAILHDVQRLLGKKQYGVTRPGQADALVLMWPAVENFQVFQDDSRGGTALVLSGFYTWWINENKPPLKKA